MVVGNGLLSRPQSGGFTCRSDRHDGGASVVDYLLAPVVGLDMITHFSIGTRTGDEETLSDHYPLYVTLDWEHSVSGTGTT